MVYHCPAEKLVEHFIEFIKKANLDLKYILHIGMDGPSVNLKFEKLLIDQLNKLILQVGTCPLHIVHNSFRYGILALSFDVDRYTRDIHFFLNLSAGRRADYKKMESVTNIVSHYAQKHVLTRWVTLKKVVVRLLEQHENLKEYFLTYLPTTDWF